MAQLLEAITGAPTGVPMGVPEQQRQAESHIVAFLRASKKGIWKDNVRSLLKQIPTSALSRISLRALISSAPVFAVRAFCSTFYCTFEKLKLLLFELALVRHVLTGDVKEVVVTHRDRLARIGYDLIQFLFEQFGTKLVVIGKSKEMGGAPESNEKLTQDLMSIVHVYSCR